MKAFSLLNSHISYIVVVPQSVIITLLMKQQIVVNHRHAVLQDRKKTHTHTHNLPDPQQTNSKKVMFLRQYQHKLYFVCTAF
jgi:hypothetical protein